MNIHTSFPSRYLKPADLDTHQPVVVIKDVEQQTMTLAGGKKVHKLVVHFVDKDKGLVLNKTNAIAIAELLGSPETEAWLGRPIRLFATMTTFAGSPVACIRVKAVGPVAAAVPFVGQKRA